ncbi:MAG: hypothetical protein M3457_01155 [Chloroflexota bacterium]|nr:hypothetical protein [Chloroflexota bacterium]
MLATVGPRTVLRIAAGVAVRHHVVYRRLALTCGGCGQVTRIDVPRKVEEIITETAEVAA